MVEATVSFAIEKLNEFITEQVNIRIEVRDGIRWLRDELSYLQLTVRDADAIPEITDLIRLWLNSVKDVANDAVIIRERFGMLDEEHARQGEGFRERMQRYICFCKKEINLYDIGKEIVFIRARIDEIKKRQEEHRIKDILATLTVPKKKRTLRRVTSFHDQDNMVGFKNEFKTLLGKLAHKDPSLRFISIHGMGGSGKSTLARQLYHCPELSHFKDRRAWVCVSKDDNTIDVLRRIIKSFKDEIDPLKNMEYVDLLRHLRKLLEDSINYLVVIDNLCEIDTWKEIQEAFTDNKNGSRIIITTRYKDVAREVDYRSFVQELPILSFDESWTLFCKKGNPTPNLENLGKEMVKKCRGLPLAIVVLSGLLFQNNSFIDWSGVNDRLWRNLQGKSAEIKDILNLSFYDLSLEMRDCFLYLARFPEDHAFRIDELMRLWIAEELISKDHERDGEIMEGVAEAYINELINRNLIQISRFQLNRDVWECRVHGLVRDLAAEKATEKKTVGIFDSSKQSPVSSLHGQTRHAIYSGIGEYLKSVGPSSDDKKLRSLAIISSRGRLESEEVKLISTRFKNLKVLDMAGVLSNEIPKEIGELVFLNFLSLMRGGSYGQPLVIPRSIGKLKRLQTLCGPSDSKYEFPCEIADELKELRHLIFAPSRVSLNISSHQTKLHTVRTIGYENWIHIDTVKFTNLHTLSITDASMEDQAGVVYTLDSIRNLTSLQTFDLELRTIAIPTIKPLSWCKHLKNVYLWGKMKDPWQLRFLPESVTNLRLVGSDFTQDPMPALESLLNLTTLYVEKIYVGEKMVCSQDSFSSLRFFKLEDHCNLKEWEIEDGALSSLKGFQIDYCYKLKMVPQQLKCIPPIPEIYDM